MSKGFDKTKLKLAAFDLDGTLLHHGVLSERTKNALERLAQSGVAVAVTTGRQYSVIPASVRELPFIDYFVTANGAKVECAATKETLFCRPLDNGVAREVLKILRASTPIYLIDYDGSGAFTYYMIFKTPELFHQKSPFAKRTDFLNMKPSLFPELRLIARKERPQKLGAYYLNRERCARTLELIKDNYPVTALTTDGLEIEVTAKGVSKASGLEAVCRRLSIDLSQAAAFGDSGNDAEMLLAAGFSVAMENAPDYMKRAADRVAPLAELDGAAQVIEELFL